MQISLQSLCSAIQICLTCASLSGQAVCSVLLGILTGIRSTDLRVSPGFHKQLHEFIFPNSSLFVASLVLCLTGMPLFSSPLRKLEVYYAVCFLDCLCLGQMGAQKGKKETREVHLILWGSQFCLLERNVPFIQF